MPTAYVVLRRVETAATAEAPTSPADAAEAAETPEGPSVWELVATLEAAGQEQAKKKWYVETYGEEHPAVAPTVVAVPARSWEPNAIKPRVSLSLS